MCFTYNRTVHFQDTDAAGVVYFANILKICHEAYEESLRVSGIDLKSFFTSPSMAFPVVHASLDFLRPIFCGDNLVTSLTPQKLDMSKFEITYKITVAGMLVAKAITRHVCIDVKSRNKQELPTEINHWLETNRKRVEEAERRKSREEIV